MRGHKEKLNFQSFATWRSWVDHLQFSLLCRCVTIGHRKIRLAADEKLTRKYLPTSKRMIILCASTYSQNSWQSADTNLWCCAWLVALDNCLCMRMKIVICKSGSYWHLSDFSKENYWNKYINIRWIHYRSLWAQQSFRHCKRFLHLSMIREGYTVWFLSNVFYSSKLTLWKKTSASV